ncbi:MAG: hypothetical protein GXP49_01905 [Deltaproteobacteria bacterium]|nr:hypothetical protein [Deltaproteobacteria bacterium]
MKVLTYLGAAMAAMLLAQGCGKDLGDPCNTKCSTGKDVHCLEQNKLNGCSSSMCVTWGNEFTPQCTPCYDAGTVSEESNRCLEGVFIKYTSRSLGACTRMCKSDDDCKGVANFVCRPCSLADSKVDFTQSICDSISKEQAYGGTMTGICAPPASEGSDKDKLQVKLSFDDPGSCYVKLAPTDQSREDYLQRARKEHPDRSCKGYCTDFCSNVGDCPSSSGWQCEAPYTVGEHELKDKTVCVRTQ